MEINLSPEYLRSRRTLTAAEVDDRARARARYDMTPAERVDTATHHAEFAASRH